MTKDPAPYTYRRITLPKESQEDSEDQFTRIPLVFTGRFAQQIKKHQCPAGICAVITTEAK